MRSSVIGCRFGLFIYDILPDIFRLTRCALLINAGKPASDDRKLAHELKSAFREELGESTEANAGALRTGAGNG
eukprot:39800-Eustigmatos_ZCMA.PRE.1